MCVKWSVPSRVESFKYKKKTSECHFINSYTIALSGGIVIIKLKILMKPYSSVFSDVRFEDRESLLLSMNHEELQHTLKGEELQVQVGIGQVARETPG